MQKELLIEKIRRHAARSRESFQIAKRLEELFPQVLRALKRTAAGGLRGSKAERYALTHPDYLEKLEQYVDVLGESLNSRVQSETHRMLLQAWQSLNAFERARENAQRKPR